MPFQQLRQQSDSYDISHYEYSEKNEYRQKLCRFGCFVTCAGFIVQEPTSLIGVLEIVVLFGPVQSNTAVTQATCKGKRDES